MTATVSTLKSLMQSLRVGGHLHRMPIRAGSTADQSQTFQLRHNGNVVHVPYSLAREAILQKRVASVGKSQDGSELYVLTTKGTGAADASNTSPGEKR